MKVICWKLTKILILLLIKAEKFYRCLYSGRGTGIQQKAVNFSRSFAELYLFPLKTYLFQTWQFYQFKGVLSGSVNRVSLTVPCQKLKKRWNVLLNSEPGPCTNQLPQSFLIGVFFSFLWLFVLRCRLWNRKSDEKVRMNGKSENKVSLLIFQLLLTFNYGQTIL